MENNETMEVMQETTDNTEVEQTEETSVWEDDEARAETSETENPQEPTSEEPQEQTETQQTTDEEEMYPETFNVDGEEKQIPMSQIKGLIQKGLVYDSTKNRYMDKLKTAYADPRIEFLETMAAAEGMNAADFMAREKMKAEYGELLNEGNYATLADVPANIMKMFVENQQASKASIEASLNERQQQQQAEKDLEEYHNFLENHPEVSEIPKEVVKLKSEGNSLEAAWAMHSFEGLKTKYAELERKYAILKKNTENKQTAMPSSRSTAKNESEAVWEFD